MYRHTYQVWQNMKNRCYNKKYPSFHRYGGRGIIVAPSWHNFESFLADMGHKPPGSTLERIDNDGNYSKENCKWASRKEQANNTARNIMLTFKGETLNLKQWSEKLGISYAVLQCRLRRGWTVDAALSTPLLRRYR